MLKFLADILKRDDSEVSRLIAMRKGKENKCQCNQCSDLISRIHFDGALTRHAHGCENQGLGFWNNNLEQVYEPDLNIELDSEELAGVSPSQRYRGCINEIEDLNSDPKIAESDSFWHQHYRNSVELLRSWLCKDESRNP